MVNFVPAAEIVSLVWGIPGNFNGFRVLAALLHGTLVVRVSQSAALNRGRHLYSAGRPSRWALAHISIVYLPSVPVCAICFVFLGVSLPGSKETATRSPRGASEANDASHEDRYVRAIRMMNYMHIVPVGPPRCAARVSEFCYTPPLLLLYAQQLKATFHYAIQLANQTSSRAGSRAGVRPASELDSA